MAFPWSPEVVGANENDVVEAIKYRPITLPFIKDFSFWSGNHIVFLFKYYSIIMHNLIPGLIRITKCKYIFINIANLHNYSYICYILNELHNT